MTHHRQWRCRRRIYYPTIIITVRFRIQLEVEQIAVLNHAARHIVDVTERTKVFRFALLPHRVATVADGYARTFIFTKRKANVTKAPPAACRVPSHY